MRIPVDLNAHKYTMDETSIPTLSASASRDSGGRIHLSIVNLEPNRSAEITTEIRGQQVQSVTGEVLTAAARNAMNTFENPAAVKPSVFVAYRMTGPELTLNVPAKSVLMMELK